MRHLLAILVSITLGTSLGRGYINTVFGNPHDEMRYRQLLRTDPKAAEAFRKMFEQREKDARERAAAAAENFRKAEANRLESFMEEWNEAIRKNPNDAQAYHKRGRFVHVHLNVFDSDRALADYDKALAIDPKMTGVLLQRGALVWGRSAERAGAMRGFEKVVALEPKNAQAHAFLALAHSSCPERRDPDRARVHAELACKLTDHDHPACLQLLAHIESRSFDNYDNAKRLQSQAAALYKRHLLRADDALYRLSRYESRQYCPLGMSELDHMFRQWAGEQ